MPMPILFSGFTALSLILLVAGLVFLMIELFNPGFGVPGVIGIVLLVADVLVTARSLREGLLLTAIAAGIILIFLIIGARLVSKGKMPKQLILHQGEEGFHSSEDLSALLGVRGKSLTVLRPAGIAELNGVRRDVVTQGEYLAKGAAVVVTEVTGSRVVVCASPVQQAEIIVKE